MQKKKTMLRTLLFGILLVATLFAVSLTADAATVTYVVDDEPWATETDLAEGAYVPYKVPEGDRILRAWKTGDNVPYDFSAPLSGDLTLYAEFYGFELSEIKELFEVTFTDGEGNIFNTQYVVKGESAVAPADIPCPTGKVFDRFDQSLDAITDNTVISAIYEDAVHTVTLLGIGGKRVASATVTYGSTFDFETFSEENAALLSVVGYDLVGVKGALLPITADAVYELDYQRSQYKVHFIKDGEAFSPTVVVEHGARVPFPGVPEKEGHIFLGWYFDGASFDFSTGVTEELTLTATYMEIVKKTYTVTFKDADGQDFQIQTVTEGQRAVKPAAPQLLGRKFLDWYDEQNAAFAFDLPIDGDVVLYARYRMQAFTVRFYDGDVLLSEQTVTFGENAKEIAAPEKVGQYFVGFDKSYQNIRENVDLYAQYKNELYVVTFLDRDGKLLVSPQIVEYGKAAKAPTPPAVRGYEFTGWSKSPERIEGNVEIIAEYEANRYTVTYKSEGSADRTEELSFGEKVTYITPTDREGMIFTVWKVDGAAYDFDQPIEGDLTLVAEWQVKPPTVYTVIFMVDDTTEFTRQSVADNEKVILPPAPYIVGKRFLGWTNADALGAPITGGLTVTARFEDITYTVTYLCGGTVVTTRVYTYLQKVEEHPEAPETLPEGYDFFSWDMPTDVAVIMDLTVNAVLTPIEYTVNFYWGDVRLSTQAVQHGRTASVPATPSIPGEKFTGWTLENGDTFSFGTPITANTDIFARTEKLSFDIIYYLNGTLYERVTGVVVGTPISHLPAPEITDENTEFLGWSEIPSVMPGGALIVNGATKTYRIYSLVYSIGEKQYIYSVREGDPLPALPSEEEILANLPAHTRYLGFEDLPEVMPAADLKLAARILREYQIIYRLYGKEVHTVWCWTGDTVTPYEIDPSLIPADTEFLGWKGEPAVMPDHAVYVDALLRMREIYYITYMVGNNKFASVAYYEGDTIQPLTRIPGADVLGAYTEFLGWQDEPTGNMPAYSMTVYAVLKVTPTFKITYWVNGEIFAEFTLKKGEAIPAVGRPGDLPHLGFTRWSEELTECPERDVNIYAIFETPRKEPNLFLARWEENEKGVTVTVSLAGEVNIAGFAGRITVPKGYVLEGGDLQTDELYLTYIDGEIRLVYTRAENLCASTEIVSFCLATDGASTFTASALEILECVYVEADGTIGEAPFTTELYMVS